MSTAETKPQRRPRLFDATGQPYPGAGLPLPLPEHIRQSLERAIIESRLEAGARIAEDELGRRLGVSRTPVREAMRMLEGEGLIVRRRGRGSTVADRTSQEQAQAIYEVRFALESHLAASAATKIADDDLALVERLRDEFDEFAAAGLHEDLVGIDSDLHWAIHNSADSDLVSIVASYWGRLQRELYGRVYRHDGEVAVYTQQHEGIVDALRRHDPAAARDVMLAHLKSGWESVQTSYALEADAAPSAPLT
jgi:DNA-binding GntR family transcriptional regulator